MADVVTSSGIGDMVEAVKRGARGLRDEAERELDRMRREYERRRTAAMLRLIAVVGVGYLILRKR